MVSAIYLRKYRLVHSRSPQLSFVVFSSSYFFFFRIDRFSHIEKAFSLLIDDRFDDSSDAGALDNVYLVKSMKLTFNEYKTDCIAKSSS